MFHGIFGQCMALTHCKQKTEVINFAHFVDYFNRRVASCSCCCIVGFQVTSMMPKALHYIVGLTVYFSFWVYCMVLKCMYKLCFKRVTLWHSWCKAHIN